MMLPQYIKAPSEAVQLQAVQESYLALRYIDGPSVAVTRSSSKARSTGNASDYKSH